MCIDNSIDVSCTIVSNRIVIILASTEYSSDNDCIAQVFDVQVDMPIVYQMICRGNCENVEVELRSFSGADLNIIVSRVDGAAILCESDKIDEFEECEVATTGDSVLEIGITVTTPGYAMFPKITASNVICVSKIADGVPATCFEAPPPMAPETGKYVEAFRTSCGIWHNLFPSFQMIPAKLALLFVPRAVTCPP